MIKFSVTGTSVMSIRPGRKKADLTTCYTAGDLAASMSLNPYLKVSLASGYYDAVTPFLQTDLDIESMPLVDPRIRENLVTRYYKSGHMIYLDNESRAEMKKDPANFISRRRSLPPMPSRPATVRLPSFNRDIADVLATHRTERGSSYSRESDGAAESAHDVVEHRDRELGERGIAWADCGL